MNAPFTGLAIQKKRTNLSPDDVTTYYNVTIEQHDNDTVASLKYGTWRCPPGLRASRSINCVLQLYCKTFLIFCTYEDTDRRTKIIHQE